MEEKVLRYKDVIMDIVQKHIAIDCIALMGDKILVGVTHGLEPMVAQALEQPLGDLGINYAVGWEISISRYPVMVVRSREWVYDK